MNEWQLSKQFRYLARLQTWPDSGGGLIWGNRVHVTNSMPKEQYAMLGSPSLLIGVNDNEADPQTPGYRNQIFTFTYWCAVAGDPRGENAMLGANRTGGALASSGRGILEYTEEVSRMFRQIQETSGIKVIARRTSEVGTGIVPGLGYVAMRQSIVEAKCSDLRYYHPPMNAVLANGDYGGLRMRFSDPPTRFDGEGLTIRIRRASGTTPPATVTDGTQVADVARGIGSYIDTTVYGVPGTYSYSLFAGYSDSGAASVERYSDGPSAEEGMSFTTVWDGTSGV